MAEQVELRYNLPLMASLHGMTPLADDFFQKKYGFSALHLVESHARHGRYGWEDHSPPSGIWKGTNGGEVISISGCDGHQNSADTSALAEVTSAGAMTFSFIQAIERGAGATYGSLLNAMRNAIHNADTEIDGAPLTTLLIMLLTGGSQVRSLTQEPQLSSSEAFDVYSKPFYL